MNRLLRLAAGPPRRPRRTRRLLFALLALMMLTPVVTAAPASAPATATREPYCFSWDFLNNTGADADGLTVSLDAVRAVSSVYAGSDNPFGAALPSSGYDPTADAYRLDFGGGPAPDAMPVRLGACLDRAALLLSPKAAAPFEWRVDGQPAAPAPLFLGAIWARQGDGGLKATLRNDGKATLVVLSASLVRLDTPLALDDLNGDTLALQPALAALDDPFALAAGGSKSFDLPKNLVGSLSGGAIALQVEFATEDDLGNVAHLYAQLLDAQRTHLPLTQR